MWTLDFPELRDSHAVHAVETIWLGGAADNAEDLARRLNAVSGLSDELRRMGIFVRSPDPPPDVTETLAELGGRFRPGVEAERLRRGLAPRRYEAPELVRVRDLEAEHIDRDEGETARRGLCSRALENQGPDIEVIILSHCGGGSVGVASQVDPGRRAWGEDLLGEDT